MSAHASLNSKLRLTTRCASAQDLASCARQNAPSRNFSRLVSAASRRSSVASSGQNANEASTSASVQLGQDVKRPRHAFVAITSSFRSLSSSSRVRETVTPRSDSRSSRQHLEGARRAPPVPRRGSQEREPEWAANFFHDTFPQLPSRIPTPLAERALTHISFGLLSQHNLRLSFIGKRVLEAYLLMFLQSANMQLAPHSDVADKAMQEVTSAVLHHHTFGVHFGPQWQVARHMQWVSATPHVSAGNLQAMRYYQTGKAKIEGVTARAIVGAIYHQYGGAMSYSIFNSQILPHLRLPHQYDAHVRNVAQQFGAPQTSKSGQSSTLSLSGSSSPDPDLSKSTDDLDHAQLSSDQTPLQGHASSGKAALSRSVESRRRLTA